MSATAAPVTQLTASNQTVEAPNGVSYAYRRLADGSAGAGTGPQGGEDMHGFADEMFVHADQDQPGADDILALFFERSETSLAKGREFLQRIFTRTEGRRPRHARGARCPAGRHHHVGHPRRESARSPRRHHSAGAGGGRRQRPPGTDEELAVRGRIRRRSRLVLERGAVSSRSPRCGSGLSLTSVRGRGLIRSR
jgi:hypothetical protein